MRSLRTDGWGWTATGAPTPLNARLGVRRHAGSLELEIADGVTEAELEEIASSLLANTVIEDWKVVRVDTAEAAS